VKEITGMGMVNGMGNFKLNGTTWNMDVINDTIMLGATEIWTWINHSNMAHPMTIHGGSFYILDRNGVPPPAWESGPKSVVNVDVGDSVRTIMRFAEYTTDGWPLMYHCHNLMHIDQMMWQFIIVDPGSTVAEQTHPREVHVFPVPSSSLVNYRAPFPVMHVQVTDLYGREVLEASGQLATSGSIDVGSLAHGIYIAKFTGQGRQALARIARE
jgi:hypothetical protein